jgi:hypothetical protein
MTEVDLLEHVGSFADNKEIARELRTQKIIPALENHDEVVINFGGVTGATQSFVHALISDLFRKYGVDILDRVSFKNCNESVKKIIEIVSDYMQESL